MTEGPVTRKTWSGVTWTKQSSRYLDVIWNNNEMKLATTRFRITDDELSLNI